MCVLCNTFLNGDLYNCYSIDRACRATAFYVPCNAVGGCKAVGRCVCVAVGGEVEGRRAGDGV